jgi:hypothetical protein
MTNHAQILSAFLRTDLYRLDAALEEQSWTEVIRARLTDHVHRLNQLLALLAHHPPPPLPALDTVESALDTLHTFTEELVTAVEELTNTTLYATVLDPHERNLPLLAHLYDYARLSAMLVEWSHHLPPTQSLDDWFDEPES